MRRRFFVLGVLCIGILLSAGCNGKENDGGVSDTEVSAQTELVSLDEIRAEANRLEDSYKNLNLSETVITIPDVDEIPTVVFPVSTDSLERQAEKFEENIRRYEGLEDSVDLTPYMNMMYWDLEENDRLIVPYEEAKDDEELMAQIQYLSYNDGKCSELLIFSDYMLEMGNYESIPTMEEETEKYKDFAYGYMGFDLGTLAASYNYQQDDISGVMYELADGSCSLQDAVDFMEKHIKEDYYFVGSEYLDYHVSEIEVRQLADAIYYYQFQIYPSYNGVTLYKDQATMQASESASDIEPFGTTHTASMFYHDQIGFVWSCCHSYESVEIQENHSEFLTLTDACKLLNQYVSASNAFSIESIELIYQTEFQYENEEREYWGYVFSIYCHPAYHFTVSNPGLFGYDQLYFDVDALTGEITTMIN